MKEQLTIKTIVGIIAAIAAIGSPFIYFGTLERANAVQDVEISATKSDIREIKENVEYIRRAIEAMSVKQGVRGATSVKGVGGTDALP